MGETRKMAWESWAVTHSGHRRKVNEDAFLNWPEQGLWAVADGVGGHADGEVASRMAVEALMEFPLVRDLHDGVLTARTILSRVNEKIWRASACVQEERGMGTTIVALLTREDQAACLWVGDSRCYLRRGNELYQLTTDHAPDMGLLTLDPNERSPRHIITRALGCEAEVEIDTVFQEICPGDVLLLCSDGVYDAVSAQTLWRVMGKQNAYEITDALLKTVLLGSASDNLTLIAIRFFSYAETS